MLRIEDEASDRFSDESFIVQYRRDEMNLSEALREGIFGQIFCNEYSAERMSDKNRLLITQVRKEFLEPDLPCSILRLLFAGHIRRERLESVGESVHDPLFPTRKTFARIILPPSEKIHIRRIGVECLSSVDEDDLVFWRGSDHTIQVRQLNS